MDIEPKQSPEGNDLCSDEANRSHHERLEHDALPPEPDSQRLLDVFNARYIASLKAVFNLRDALEAYLDPTTINHGSTVSSPTLACHGVLEYREDCSIEFLTFGQGQPVLAIDGFLVHFNYSLLYLKDLPDSLFERYQFILINPQGVGLTDYGDRSKLHHFIHDVVASMRTSLDYKLIAFSAAAKHIFDFLSIREDDRCAGIYLASPPPLQHLLEIPQRAREFAMLRSQSGKDSALNASAEKTGNMFEAIMSEMKLYKVAFQGEDEKLLRLAFRHFNLNFRTCLDIYEKHADYELFCERAKNLHVLHCTEDPKFDYKCAVEDYRERFAHLDITEHYINSGHFPDWTHREQFLEIIERFLVKSDQRTSSGN